MVVKPFIPTIVESISRFNGRYTGLDYICVDPIRAFHALVFIALHQKKNETGFFRLNLDRPQSPYQDRPDLTRTDVLIEVSGNSDRLAVDDHWLDAKDLIEFLEGFVTASRNPALDGLTFQSITENLRMNCQAEFVDHYEEILIEKLGISKQQDYKLSFLGFSDSWPLFVYENLMPHGRSGDHLAIVSFRATMNSSLTGTRFHLERAQLLDNAHFVHKPGPASIGQNIYEVQYLLYNALS